MKGYVWEGLWLHKDEAVFALHSAHPVVDNRVPTYTHRLNLLKTRDSGFDDKALGN